MSEFREENRSRKIEFMNQNEKKETPSSISNTRYEKKVLSFELWFFTFCFKLFAV